MARDSEGIQDHADPQEKTVQRDSMLSGSEKPVPVPVTVGRRESSVRPMPQEFSMPTVSSLVEQFIAPLFAGDRSGARAVVAEAFEEGLSAEEIIMQVIWPTMEKIQGLYRAD